jgi:hypothetical protein
VHGRGAPLFIAAAVLAVLAVLFPTALTAGGHRLPWGNVQRVWAVSAGVVALLLLGGVVRAARRLTFDGRTVRIHGLFGRLDVPARQITALTIQTSVGGGEHPTTTDYLTVWFADRVSARLNLWSWRSRDLALLVGELLRLYPAVQVAPEVRRALGMQLASTSATPPLLRSSEPAASGGSR